MIKYDKYKPSGVDWLGDIPKDWEIKRVKDVSKINEKTINEKVDKNYQFRYVDIGNVNQNGIINEPEIISFFEAPSRARRIVRENDIIISTVRTYLKAVAFIDFVPNDYIVSTGFAVLTPNNKTNPKYLAFYSQSETFIDLVIRFSTGVSYPAINSSTISDIYIIQPSFEIQTQIANYLDTKTHAIDKKINLLNQKVNYYKEYRKSLINETVCIGLNKNVKLKKSDINYINDIPQHWKIERIKNLFNIGRGRVIGQELLVENGKYPVYSSQTENDGCLGFIETYDFDNDLLTWTTDGANAGTVFRRSGKFNCTNVCGTLIPKRRNLDLNYVVYALQESATHNKRIDTNGAKIMNNEMAVINIAFPPLKEQTKIANYLDNKTQTIDKIVSNINTQIQTLKELRKTLINDVVTGKIKVVK